MKQKRTDFTFNAAAKTLTFEDDIDLDGLLVIFNKTDNIGLFNFADTTKTATVANNVVTLAYDTAAMSNTDDILVYWDDGYPQATSALQETLYSLTETLQDLVARLSVIAGWASSGQPGMRVVGVSMPSTAVTGPITQAQFEQSSNYKVSNLVAETANIKNAVGA